MSSAFLKATLGSCAAAALVVVPGVAGAVKSYQGDDYSFDTMNWRQMYTCDREADGKDVHSDAKLANRTTVGRASVDTDGPGGTCGSSVLLSSDIVQHRTCEEIDWWPDKCGNWVGTTAPPGS